jgi:putative colanic acid biosynthesis UDP-glucose lipid carrier transferase
VGILNENCSGDYENKGTLVLLLQSIHSAAAENVNELYIIVKPDFITDLNYYFELGRHSMRLKFVPDFSTISKAHFSTGSFDHFHVIKPRHEPLQNFIIDWLNNI